MTRAARARPVFLTLAAVGVAAGCAAWALRPLPLPTELAGPVQPAAAAPLEPVPSEQAPFDLAAFSAPLWIAPPPPPPRPVAAQPPPPPPPLRLQLVGIVLENGAARAVLYDPDTDVLHIVGSGETVGRCTVEGVTSTQVTLREGELLRTLALREDLKGAGGPP